MQMGTGVKGYKGVQGVQISTMVRGTQQGCNGVLCSGPKAIPAGGGRFLGFMNYSVRSASLSIPEVEIINFSLQLKPVM